MTTLLVLLVAIEVFLALAWATEWVARRLREPGPYRDTSRGTSRRD